MTLDRDTVEQKLSRGHAEGVWTIDDARALAEDWLRKEEALDLARSGWAHYQDGQKAKGTRLLDAALAPLAGEET